MTRRRYLSFSTEFVEALVVLLLLLSLFGVGLGLRDVAFLMRAVIEDMLVGGGCSSSALCCARHSLKVLLYVDRALARMKRCSEQ